MARHHGQNAKTMQQKVKSRSNKYDESKVNALGRSGLPKHGGDPRRSTRPGQSELNKTRATFLAQIRTPPIWADAAEGERPASAAGLANVDWRQSILPPSRWMNTIC
jgi:hypothetical protein